MAMSTVSRHSLMHATTTVMLNSQKGNGVAVLLMYVSNRNVQLTEHVVYDCNLDIVS